MHELGLAREIVERALAELPEPTRRVRAMRIRMGAASVDPAALVLSIQALAQGTRAEGAEVMVAAMEEDGVLLESIDVEARP